MHWLVWLIGTVVLAVALASLRAPLRLWTGVFGAYLALWTLVEQPGPLFLGLGWGLFAVVALGLNLPGCRRALVIRPALRTLRRLLPPLSDTEREAIDAGTVWWDGELFSGRPDWRRLLSTPPADLSAEEQAFLDGPVEELCRMLDDWSINHELEGISDDIWSFLKRHRFFGMIIPKTYGGLEFSALAHSAVVMKVCSRSPTAGVVVMVPNSLGPAELLLQYGTQAQKDHYLPRLARGEEIPCFGLTGPRAGSDAGAMTDSGVVCRGEFRDQKDVLGIRLNWDKRYITLAPVATLLGLAFKLYDPERLLGERKSLGITVALVPADTPGVTVGDRHRPLGMAFYNGPTTGKDVFIPLDWIIGGADMAGKGWTMLMNALAAGRSISLPALSTASAKMAARMTGGYARVRHQFGVSIGEFEGVQEVLAPIGGHTYLMDGARSLTTTAVDLGEKPSVLSAIVKYHLTERMRDIINAAMDVHGGKTICQGPRNYLARAYLGLPVAITVEGANILTRSMIIFGQGAIRCHPYVLREMNAAADTDERRALHELDAALCAHTRHVLANLVRAPLLGLSGARPATAPVDGPGARYYRQLTRLSAALALMTDVSLLLLGGKLKRLEGLSARLGDVLSQLYLASAALKRFEDEGRPRADEPLLHWACQDALVRAQGALDGFLRNFPQRPVAALLRVLVFPLGQPYPPPSDRLGARIARLLQTPGEARDRLSAGIFIPERGDRAAAVEEALLQTVAAEPAARKLAAAVKDGTVQSEEPYRRIDEALGAGLLSREEADQLRAAESARDEAIRVDAFPPESFGREAGSREAPPLRAAP
ncbi:MAG: acyl-CoA dehydrogenase [Gammaproteobacteria bacterium]|nr:acyl-CoA dehydrogenase [Gammaproteobacteria bacterium]NIR84577.1 acyl-CoA dehydrogenase [Gammaproteobacteria bacterium]NIR90480.1 acyl-CoA dehydrogenase [Gammaproteobacteria bacterium]NIU05628.1 acyl-CoA dehydrogenase [Gammaproteobacteria bacterium]NIV52767.1 acyl-CoA dehydrogenase [Gammaproteobacteria bacterium]